MRYYSTQRPVTPGSFPSGYAVEEIVNFDRKTHGYIDFAQPLPEGEAQKWELTQAGLKTYWCVTSSFDDRGRVTAAITRVVETTEKPENSFISTPRKDIYNDWFDSREAALEHIEEAKRA